jgi:hypothetical protein
MYLSSMVDRKCGGRRVIRELLMEAIVSRKSFVVKLLGTPATNSILYFNGE